MFARMFGDPPPDQLRHQSDAVEREFIKAREATQQTQEAAQELTNEVRRINREPDAFERVVHNMRQSRLKGQMKAGTWD